MMLSSSLIVLCLALSSVAAHQPVISTTELAPEILNKMPPSNSNTMLPTPPSSTTSTPAPTTSILQPTPTPKPTPVPDPTRWVVRDKNNTICILANMVINMNVEFTTKFNKKVNTKFQIRGVGDAVASGDCSDSKQTLVLTTNSSLVAEFEFLRSVTNGTAASTYSLSKINLKVPNNASESSIVLTHDTKVFSLAISKSYSCDKEIKLSLSGSSINKTVQGNMTLSHLQVEAFSKKQKASYSEAVNCSPSSPSTSNHHGLIIVMVTLVILVIAGIISYFVYRHKMPALRDRVRGYSTI